MRQQLIGENTFTARCTLSQLPQLLQLPQMQNDNWSNLLDDLAIAYPNRLCFFIHSSDGDIMSSDEDLVFEGLVSNNGNEEGVSNDEEVVTRYFISTKDDQSIAKTMASVKSYYSSPEIHDFLIQKQYHTENEFLFALFRAISEETYSIRFLSTGLRGAFTNVIYALENVASLHVERLLSKEYRNQVDRGELDVIEMLTKCDIDKIESMHAKCGR